MPGETNVEAKEKNSQKIALLEKRIEALEKSGAAIAKGFQRIESDDIEEERIESGTHFGVEFKPDRYDW